MNDKKSQAAQTSERLPLTSADMTAALISQLRATSPQIFSEGRVDFAKLQAALGEHIETNPERYGLTWAGKRDAFRNVQIPSVATLRPQPDESVNWDSSENLIIEGDNLEVLKLLQKPYHARVKMIYIDPPYNTGNEFIYPDNFREGLDDYLRYTGQLGEDGTATSTNKDTSGRYHSNWLNMMYPRLFLARNLLKEDGVIFVSIDDHEVHNLRLLMDEVFGEENFVACICWQKKYAPSNDTVDFSPMHDFILVYGKERKYTDGGKAIALLNRQERTEENNKLYKNPDYDERGLWRTDNYLCNKTAEQRPNLYYAITHPKTGQEVWPSRSAVWRYSKERHEQNVRENRVWWGIAQDNSVPAYKRFLSEVSGVIATTWWTHQESGHNDEAKKETRLLMGDSGIEFDTPKPVRLLKRMIELATHKPEKAGDDDAPLAVHEKPASYLTAVKKATRVKSDAEAVQDIILDFFAGSGTTAHAVLDLNQQDGGNRRFILVQLPEKTDNPQYPTIAHITRERVRRVIAKLQENRHSGAGRNPAIQNALDLNPLDSRLRGNDEGGRRNDGDLGFRAFKLDSSNFKIWRSDKAPQSAEQLAEQLSLYADNVLAERGDQDRLYELILKCGMALSARVEEVSLPVRPEPVEGHASTRSGRTAFSIADGNLLICLEPHLDRDMLRALFARKPQMVLCLDTAFDGNDALKTNTVLEAQTHGIIFKTV
jgi:adenine-specific DNA-methyltransferase